MPKFKLRYLKNFGNHTQKHNNLMKNISLFNKQKILKLLLIYDCYDTLNKVLLMGYGLLFNNSKKTDMK